MGRKRPDHKRRTKRSGAASSGRGVAVVRDEGRFVPGQPSANPAGRPPGIPQKTTILAKEAIARVFELLGGEEAMVKWARDNPGEFYRLYGRLIPVQLAGEGGGPILTRVSRVLVDPDTGEEQDIGTDVRRSRE